MKYIETPLTISKSAKMPLTNDINKLDTGKILLHLLKKHKFGLVVTYAVWLTYYTFTPWLLPLVISFFN